MVYFDGYGYNFYYGNYGYYEYSRPPSLMDVPQWDATKFAIYLTVMVGIIIIGICVFLYNERKSSVKIIKEENDAIDPKGDQAT